VATVRGVVGPCRASTGFEPVWYAAHRSRGVPCTKQGLIAAGAGRGGALGARPRRDERRGGLLRGAQAHAPRRGGLVELDEGVVRFDEARERREPEGALLERGVHAQHLVLHAPARLPLLVGLRLA